MDELLQHAPCGFLSFRDDGRIAEVNATLLDLLGYAREEFVQMHVEKIFSVAGRIFYQTHFFPLLKLKGRVEEIYLDLRSPTGAAIPVLVNAARREKDGEPFNDCVFIAIHQRSEYEEAILRAKKAAEAATVAKDEFLSVVSHELRTPLNAILGWARMLQSSRMSPETQKNAIETILRNAQTQTHLIEDILDFGRIVSGKLRLDVSELDLADVVRQAVTGLTPAANAKKIQVSVVLDSSATVSGDANRLQQVVWNLLTNAVKFTPKGGRVQVRLRRVASNVELSVTDTGKGISADFMPFIFERFQQQDTSTTRRHSGLGLGMAITRHIVELHGGTIGAESPGEGFGATFTVRLPVLVAREPAAAPGAPENLRLPAGDAFALDERIRLDGFHALVVDDEADARELISFILTNHGARVTTAASVGEAVEKYRAAEPNLVISDIEMPEEDGFTLIEKLRAVDRPAQSAPAPPVIALTGHARPSDRLKILSAGYQIHLAKPIEPAELLTVVSNFAKRSEKKS